MNRKQFLDAMEGIRDEYILSAQARLGYIPAKGKRRVLSVKRIFTAALAAVLVLLCTVAAAMAVSPEFREAVISLFQIGETERVPDVPEKGYEVKQIIIGGEVSAQYVKVDGVWLSDDGETVLRQWDNGRDRFWDIQDGQLVELGMDARETTAHLRWQDRELTICFRTFVHEGLLYDYDVTGNGPSEFDDGHYFSVSLRPERLGHRTDVVVLSGWSASDKGEASWNWICDVETGEVWDVLADCGVEKLGAFHGAEFAEGLNYALVRAGNSVMGSPYLIDLKEKTCTPLNQLFGVEVDENTFGSYEVCFYDDDTVLVFSNPLWRPGPTSVWACHIPSGAVTPTVVEEEGLTDICTDTDGNTTMVQKVDEDGNITIIDLGNGKRVELEGITLDYYCFFKANAARSKLLWVEWGEGTQERVGIIDLETGVFTAFAREPLSAHFNETFNWLGNDRVVTTIDLHTGEEYTPGEEEFYLCVYEF